MRKKSGFILNLQFGTFSKWLHIANKKRQKTAHSHRSSLCVRLTYKTLSGNLGLTYIHIYTFTYYRPPITCLVWCMGIVASVHDVWRHKQGKQKNVCFHIFFLMFAHLADIIVVYEGVFSCFCTLYACMRVSIICEYVLFFYFLFLLSVFIFFFWYQNTQFILYGAHIAKISTVTCRPQCIKDALMPP